MRGGLVEKLEIFRKSRGGGREGPDSTRANGLLVKFQSDRDLCHRNKAPACGGQNQIKWRSSKPNRRPLEKVRDKFDFSVSQTDLIDREET